ncbi:hypothetical protein IU474_06000 [Nocardia otitidiscaviarum]|uniref:hypothetical protein n=1 Tax=Nocardia otitidiscaviarum TaxID=1823 RepID=UPI001895185F|nr:hypothetical protein [Nocardia otitidiscaviarum]MBF6236630.1 hypothetical protein [Nocardia otitidiscaviarum]
MRSFEEQYAALLARAKRVGAHTPRAEIYLIRHEIKTLDYRLSRAEMTPERRDRLNRASWEAAHVLELQRYVLKHPPVTGPQKPRDSDRDRRRSR